jgi:ABC-type lipoprotein release transport system permease subunit
MNIPFELHVALRYLFAKRKQALISLISFISVIGVGVGVMAVIIALAMMTGLQQEVRDRILGASAHINVWKRNGITDYRAEVARLRQVPHVVGAAPAILGQALVAASGAQLPMQIKGIDPDLEPSVTQLADSITSGSLALLEPGGPDDLAGIVLGSDLARRLGLAVGDRVSVTTRAFDRQSASCRRLAGSGWPAFSTSASWRSIRRLASCRSTRPGAFSIRRRWSSFSCASIIFTLPPRWPTRFPPRSDPTTCLRTGVT